MAGISPIIGGQGPVLPTDTEEFGAGNAVCYAADGFAEEGLVVGFVLLGGVEALDDVCAVDCEGLDVGAEGEE